MVGTEKFPALKVIEDGVLPNQKDDYNCGIGLVAAIGITQFRHVLRYRFLRIGVVLRPILCCKSPRVIAWLRVIKNHCQSVILHQIRKHMEQLLKMALSCRHKIS